MYPQEETTYIFKIIIILLLFSVCYSSLCNNIPYRGSGYLTTYYYALDFDLRHMKETDRKKRIGNKAKMPARTRELLVYSRDTLTLAENAWFRMIFLDRMKWMKVRWPLQMYVKF